MADTFDNRQKQANLMSLGALNTLLADFKITKSQFARVGEIKQIVLHINSRL